MILRSLLLATCIILSVSCKNEIKKEVENTSEAKQTVIETLQNPATGNSALPRLFSNGSQLFLSWVEQKDSVSLLKYSVMARGAWQKPVMVTSGADWFVNWADFPAIAENNGNILTSFLQKSAEGTYTYDVKLNLFTPGRSDTSKEKWKKNFILHDDGTKSEHGFVSMIPSGPDGFFVSWLDGRHTSGGHDTHDGHSEGGAMTLRGAVVTAEGEITQEFELDPRVCDCCGTSAAMTSKGPVVVYRDRSGDEIRDVSIVRWEAGAWTAPKTVAADDWKIAGCPVNGPAVDAKGDALAVAWFTAPQGEGDIKVAFSSNGGVSFGRSFRIDGENANGRVDVVMLNQEAAAVLWMEPRGEETVLQLIKVNVHGYTEPPVTIAITSAERTSGFPQMELVGDTLYLAWTEVEENSKSIKTASVAISEL
ncbi:hypothetical protein [Altibacter sp.]|uniref:hypothetical protein n=1 Tax=Altibacter sp. TaxID=2024823 RepID=UPI002587B1E2|nr:hypothetical protein [Altibacter sp.]MCW9037661.1 hypothetical protein [Altibacter sp.]